MEKQTRQYNGDSAYANFINNGDDHRFNGSNNIPVNGWVGGSPDFSNRSSAHYSKPDSYNGNMVNGHGSNGAFHPQHPNQRSSVQYYPPESSQKTTQHQRRYEKQSQQKHKKHNRSHLDEQQISSKNPRAHQNANAILKDHSKKKHVLREGKHAAAIDQIHENDLHGIEVLNREKPEGRQPHRDSIYQQQSPAKINLHQRPRVRQSSTYEDTELTTSFDPMKDRHLWAMWRTAVNGRIVDAVRRLENTKDSPDPVFSKGRHNRNGEPTHRSEYRPSIVAPPLKRFIKLQEGSREIANTLSNEGRGQLHASQFVFYGLPRVYMDKGPPSGN